MKIGKVLTAEEVAAGEAEDTARAYREANKRANPPQQKYSPEEGDILSYDNQPAVLNEIYPERKKRIFSRVSKVSGEDAARYVRLNYIRANDWQEFSKETVQQRIANGEMELHDQWQLINLIADSLEAKNQHSIASQLREIVNLHEHSS